MFRMSRARAYGLPTLLAAVALAAGIAAAAPRPATAAGSMTHIVSGADTILAYVAVPAGGARKGMPAIVVVQEWWGLVDWVKSVADRFAAKGYIAIAPDLYRGKVATDPELAHELMRGLPDARALRDIHAAAAYVRTPEGGGAKRLGVVGFCMGGRLALLSALDKGPFVATVICYGSPETDPKRLRTLRGPVLGIYGSADRGIGRDQTDALEAGLYAVNREGAVIVYPDAGHGFLNDTRPGQYDPAASLLAWKEIEEFLATQLRP